MAAAGIDDGAGASGLREVVLHGVHRCAAGRTFLQQALAREFERTHFPARLRGAATQLASGIIRRRLTLDHLIAAFSDRPLARIDPLLLDVLRLAVYELLFVERVPAHAAVDEAVKLTKRLVREEFSGFANAVLRSLLRAVAGTSRIEGPLGPSRRDLAVAPDRVVRFSRDLFCDPAGDPVGYLAAAGGMPRWLVERWQRAFGIEAAVGIVEASNAPPRVTLRVNTLKTTAEALAATLARADVKTSPGDVEHSLVVETPVELTSLDAFRAGEFYIQDTSSMRAPRVLAPREGEKVLDLCAAPGGKTTHLAELARDRAEVCALDVSPARLRLVEQNAARLGITGVKTAVGDARRIHRKFKHVFDAVLADVPCSNTGVLRRRVEARHRLTPRTFPRMARTQADILRTALAAVRPGGRVVYSTCSIECEENADVIAQALKNNPDCKLEAEEVRLPELAGGDGGYVARLICR